MSPALGFELRSRTALKSTLGLRAKDVGQGDPAGCRVIEWSAPGRLAPGDASRREGLLEHPVSLGANRPDPNLRNCPSSLSDLEPSENELAHFG